MQKVKSISLFMLLTCLLLTFSVPALAKAEPARDPHTWAIQAMKGKVAYADLDAAEDKFALAGGWTDSEVQLKYDNLTDEVFDVLVYNTSTSWPKDYAEFGVPAGWFLSVHYPQGTGNAFVDADLKEMGKAYFMNKLPIDPETFASLNPFFFSVELGLYGQKDEDKKADAATDEGINMWFLHSFASQLLLKELGVEITGLPKAYGDNPRFEQFLTTYITSKPSTNYITVAFTDWYDTGGAHPDWTVQTYTYDLTTGKQLTLADVVNDPKTNLPKIQQKLAQLVTDQYGKEIVDGFLSDDYLQALGSADNPGGPVSALFTPEGLTLVYNRYDPAPGYLGNIFISIPKQDLKGLGFNTQYWE